MPLSHEEQVYFEVCSAWKMANGGGTSQALSGAGCEVLVAALREIGATEMIAPIIRLDQSIRDFEKQNSDLDWQALVEEASAMKRVP